MGLQGKQKMLSQLAKNNFIDIITKIKSSDCPLFNKIQKRVDKIIIKIHERLCLCETDQFYIDDVVNYMLDFCKGKKNSPLFKRATNRQLEEYQVIFANTLNIVYDDFKPYKIFKSDSYIINSFYYKNEPNNPLFYDTKLSDEDIDAIVKGRISNSIYTTKVLRFYDKNTIYFIKPKQYRFWLKSIAVTDANETFADGVLRGEKNGKTNKYFC